MIRLKRKIFLFLCLAFMLQGAYIGLDEEDDDNGYNRRFIDNNRTNLDFKIVTDKSIEDSYLEEVGSILIFKLSKEFKFEKLLTEKLIATFKQDKQSFLNLIKELNLDKKETILDIAVESGYFSDKDIMHLQDFAIDYSVAQAISTLILDEDIKVAGLDDPKNKEDKKFLVALFKNLPELSWQIDIILSSMETIKSIKEYTIPLDIELAILNGVGVGEEHNVYERLNRARLLPTLGQKTEIDAGVIGIKLYREFKFEKLLTEKLMESFNESRDSFLDLVKRLNTNRRQTILVYALESGYIGGRDIARLEDFVVDYCIAQTIGKLIINENIKVATMNSEDEEFLIDLINNLQAIDWQIDTILSAMTVVRSKTDYALSENIVRAILKRLEPYEAFSIYNRMSKSKLLKETVSNSLKGWLIDLKGHRSCARYFTRRLY